MTSETTTIMFNISPSFLEALESFVGAENTSRAHVVRVALADHIGYDLTAEPKTARKSKYSSPEEAKAAQKERAKKRRQLTSKLLAAYDQEDNEDAIKALIASLKDLDNE